MGKRTALITGQDESYLAELLVDQGYPVGMTRRTSTEVHERIEHLVDRIEIVSGDLLDQSSMTTLISDVAPDEVYNLAAQSLVPTSWTQQVLTGEFTALCVNTVDVPIAYGDNAKLTETTGWAPAFTLACSLRDVCDAARAAAAV